MGAITLWLFSLLLHGNGLWTKDERKGVQEERRRERGNTRSEAGEAKGEEEQPLYPLT